MTTYVHLWLYGHMILPFGYLALRVADMGVYGNIIKMCQSGQEIKLKWQFCEKWEPKHSVGIFSFFLLSDFPLKLKMAGQVGVLLQMASHFCWCLMIYVHSQSMVNSPNWLETKLIFPNTLLLMIYLKDLMQQWTHYLYGIAILENQNLSWQESEGGQNWRGA